MKRSEFSAHERNSFIENLIKMEEAVKPLLENIKKYSFGKIRFDNIATLVSNKFYQIAFDFEDKGIDFYENDNQIRYGIFIRLASKIKESLSILQEIKLQDATFYSLGIFKKQLDSLIEKYNNLCEYVINYDLKNDLVNVLFELYKTCEISEFLEILYQEDKETLIKAGYGEEILVIENKVLAFIAERKQVASDNPAKRM